MENHQNQDMPIAVFAAHLWLTNGFRVLPCQPGTKSLIAGFGPNLDSLSSAEGIEFWFRARKSNLAVISPPDGLILDFDNPELYEQFAEDCPEIAASYTERTPRGGAHVFAFGGLAVGEVGNWEAVPGLELKRLVLVYPSLVNGRPYLPLSGKILTVDLREGLRGYAEDKRPPSPASARPGPSQGKLGASLGIISKVKLNWPISSYLAYFEPKLRLAGAGRWRSGICPWHSDKRPSLWIDAERGLWGCHSCGAHGDVINWHARKTNLDNVDAARDLDRYHVEVPA